jgi:hypothetical protein
MKSREFGKVVTYNGTYAFLRPHGADRDVFAHSSQLPAHYEIAKRAYEHERRGWQASIESFWESEDKKAAERFERNSKRNAEKP